MEVLVLFDFKGTMEDELTVQTGDVLKKVTQASEEGWLAGELNGKRGIFPASFVKEVPVSLRGNSKRVPRSVRSTKKMMKQARTCRVAYAYDPINEDELQLVVGETIDIISTIEDGWWMGIKNGKVGVFPSNFVQEIFVSQKDGKHNDIKTRPKLSDATFSKEKASQKASVRSKAKRVVECCHVMFDYEARAEDELDLKTGENVVILRKETEDEGWWEGELNGRCGFFPDNFVMVIPPMDSEAGNTSLPPARSIKKEVAAPKEGPAMDKGVPTKAKDDKNELKDLRSHPPAKVKLPSIKKLSPPATKDKPAKLSPKANGDAGPKSPRTPVKKNANHFDDVDMDSDKLNHPTATRAKPPQRRPPSGGATGPQTQTESQPESTKKVQNEKLPGLQKGAEQLKPTKPECPPKSPAPVRPSPPRVVTDSRKVAHKQEGTLEILQADIKDLRKALELLQAQHVRDIEQVKEELKEERNKRLALQEEVHVLGGKH
nr:CD2-associated protein-like [Nerophis lumbriciformis]